MILALETTVWRGVKVPNHTYVLNDSMTKMLGYIPAGQSETKHFSKELTFDKRGRTFKILSKKETPSSSVRVVLGSKGKTYYVDTISKTCSCPGFTYRGYCKHVSG